MLSRGSAPIWFAVREGMRIEKHPSLRRSTRFAVLLRPSAGYVAGATKVLFGGVISAL
jgi:hypothetical protein